MVSPVQEQAMQLRELPELARVLLPAREQARRQGPALRDQEPEPPRGEPAQQDSAPLLGHDRLRQRSARPM